MHIYLIYKALGDTPIVITLSAVYQLDNDTDNHIWNVTGFFASRFTIAGFAMPNVTLNLIGKIYSFLLNT